MYALVRKEAVLSARIDGTQATVMELLEIEASGEALDARALRDPPTEWRELPVCGFRTPRTAVGGPESPHSSGAT